MTEVVVDASIGGAWILPDETSPVADAVVERILASGGAVPTLWDFEMTNIVVIALRRGRITQADGTLVLDRLRDLPLRRAPALRHSALLQLAATHTLTAYDAAYLELALREGLPLATLDKELRKAARKAKVELV